MSQVRIAEFLLQYGEPGPVDSSSPFCDIPWVAALYARIGSMKVEIGNASLSWFPSPMRPERGAELPGEEDDDFFASPSELAYYPLPTHFPWVPFGETYLHDLRLILDTEDWGSLWVYTGTEYQVGTEYCWRIDGETERLPSLTYALLTILGGQVDTPFLPMESAVGRIPVSMSLGDWSSESALEELLDPSDHGERFWSAYTAFLNCPLSAEERKHALKRIVACTARYVGPAQGAWVLSHPDPRVAYEALLSAYGGDSKRVQTGSNWALEKALRWSDPPFRRPKQ